MDLILVLNKALQQVNLPTYKRFNKVRYFELGAISGLLTKKSNTDNLLRDHLTALIQAAKSVDKRVIRIEVLKY